MTAIIILFFHILSTALFLIVFYTHLMGRAKTNVHAALRFFNEDGLGRMMMLKYLRLK